METEPEFEKDEARLALKNLSKTIKTFEDEAYDRTTGSFVNSKNDVKPTIQLENCRLKYENEGSLQSQSRYSRTPNRASQKYSSKSNHVVKEKDSQFAPEEETLLPSPQSSQTSSSRENANHVYDRLQVPDSLTSSRTLSETSSAEWDSSQKSERTLSLRLSTDTPSRESSFKRKLNLLDNLTPEPSPLVRRVNCSSHEHRDEEEQLLEALRQVVRKCSNPDPLKRPSASEVNEMLQGYL